MRIVLSFIVATFVLAGCIQKVKIKVGLQPFDHFGQALMDTISISLEHTYGVDVYILESKPISPQAFTDIKSPRYRADKLIEILKNEKADTLDYIIGLTTKDISYTKRDEFGNVKEPKEKYSDWGIFGLGYRPGPSCVVSTYRLKNGNELKFNERVKKVSLHELGHNFGLDHCDSEFCLMKDAVEKIATIDLVKLKLCDRCKKKIE